MAATSLAVIGAWKAAALQRKTQADQARNADLLAKDILYKDYVNIFVTGNLPQKRLALTELCAFTIANQDRYEQRTLYLMQDYLIAETNQTDEKLISEILNFWLEYHKDSGETPTITLGNKSFTNEFRLQTHDYSFIRFEKCKFNSFFGFSINLSFVEFIQCQFSSCRFMRSDLTEANFLGCTFGNLIIHNCHLENVSIATGYPLGEPIFSKIVDQISIRGCYIYGLKIDNETEIVPSLLECRNNWIWQPHEIHSVLDQAVQLIDWELDPKIDNYLQAPNSRAFGSHRIPDYLNLIKKGEIPFSRAENIKLTIVSTKPYKILKLDD